MPDRHQASGAVLSMFGVDDQGPAAGRGAAEVLGMLRFQGFRWVTKF